MSKFLLRNFISKGCLGTKVENTLIKHQNALINFTNQRYSIGNKMSNDDSEKLTNILNGTEDRYGGITVESIKEKCDADIFSKKLKCSMSQWIEKGKNALWFKVDLRNADWVPVLAQNGFNYHHAHEGFVMMYKWLSDKPFNGPPYSHTNLSVGSVIINKSNQILVVSEKHALVSHWKLPGGYVERGEDIIDAAIREVKEETGIDAEFHSIISFIHAHNNMFGNSDIYMIVQLNPLSNNIKQCERELNGCQWMNIEEYLNHPKVHGMNKSLLRKVLEYKKKNIKFGALKDMFKLITMTKEFTVFTLEDEKP